MTKILIFGGNGFLGSELRRIYPDAAAPRADIAEAADVRKALDEAKPDIVINAAGKTGKPNVDWCEDHKEETIRANVLGPLILLDECMKRGIYLAHIGSGCIYTGYDHPFTEDDEPNFTGSFYAFTKAMSNDALRPFPVLQLRLRMPFDGSTNDRNLVMKLKKYTKILDIKNSITYLPDFFMALQTLVAKKATGIYNVVNPGEASPYRIMQLYKEIVDPAHAFERLTVEELGTVVKAGRSNCLLSGEKLKKEGIVMRPVEEALREAMEKMGSKRG